MNAFLKIVVAAIIIYLAWDKFNFEQINFVLTNPLLFLIIPLCWILNQILTTLRLHTILRILKRPTRLSDTLRANLSSLFVGNLIPGVVGADVVKFFNLRKHDPLIKKSQLALILTIDRILGLISVLFWCSFFSFFIARKSSDSTMLLTYLPIAILLSVFIAVIVLNLFATFLLRFRIPAIIRDLIETCKILVQGGEKKLLFLMMFYNLLAVLVLLTGLVIVGGKLQLQQSGESMIALQFFLIPLVLVAAMLPITPMGVGVAQITMAGAYSLFGLDSAVGVSVSTLSQIALLGVSIFIGGASFFLDTNFKFDKKSKKI